MFQGKDIDVELWCSSRQRDGGPEQDRKTHWINDVPPTNMFDTLDRVFDTYNRLAIDIFMSFATFVIN